jgi:VWFA-related protein
MRRIAPSPTRHTTTPHPTGLISLLTLLLLAPALLFGAPALAQDGFGDEIDVEEVLLDVVVTDEQGKPVLGLDRDDFIVREDGEPAAIRSVDFRGNQNLLDSTHGTQGTDTDAADNRYFILFFHNQRTLLPRLAANLLDVGRRAKQWVNSSLQPGDYVAVVSYFPKYNLLDFTNDEETLLATIDQAVQGKDFTLKTSSRAGGIPSLNANLPEGDVDRIYEALAVTAEAAGSVRGRKNLLLFSIGFGEVDSFGFYLPDERYYPEMVQTLNDNQVAVYQVDLLANDLSPFLRSNRYQHVLSQMAMETGGQFYFNFTNYLTPLEQATEDNQGYYLISFEPTDTTKPGEYQEVSVETLNSNYRIRAREGYLAGDDYPYGEAR